MKKKPLSLTIGWLYPRLMSTYGDRGNILVLKKRCQLREIELTVVDLTEQSSAEDFKKVDGFFGGGAQDREQGIVMKDLKGEKQKILIEKVEKQTPALFVCGAPQLMGKWYEPGVGERIEGVGIFDLTTTHPGENQPRLIGNVVAKLNWACLESTHSFPRTDSQQDYIVGFENHGGRTTLGSNVKPLAKVIVGNGNNGSDKTEGVVYKNAIGTYFHGPLLPKNPHIADWFLKTILETKYNTNLSLTKLDDSLEYIAQRTVAKRLGVDL